LALAELLTSVKLMLPHRKTQMLEGRGAVVCLAHLLLLLAVAVVVVVVAVVEEQVVVVEEVLTN
jgi:hypothetical protein